LFLDACPTKMMYPHGSLGQSDMKVSWNWLQRYRSASLVTHRSRDRYASARRRGCRLGWGGDAWQRMSLSSRKAYCQTAI